MFFNRLSSDGVHRSAVISAVALFAALAFVPIAAPTQTSKPTIVLVHGAS
jgi:hypothetical protein